MLQGKYQQPACTGEGKGFLYEKPSGIPPDDFLMSPFDRMMEACLAGVTREDLLRAVSLGRLEGLKDRLDWIDADYDDLKWLYGKHGTRVLSREQSDAARKAIWEDNEKMIAEWKRLNLKDRI